MIFANKYVFKMQDIKSYEGDKIGNVENYFLCFTCLSVFFPRVVSSVNIGYLQESWRGTFIIIGNARFQFCLDCKEFRTNYVLLVIRFFKFLLGVEICERRANFNLRSLSGC